MGYTYTHTRTHTEGERNQLCFGAMRRGAALVRLLAAPVRALEHSALFFLATTERAIIDNATRPEADPQAGSQPSSESASQAKPSQARPSQASSGQLLYTNFLCLFGSLYCVLLFSVPLTLNADGSSWSSHRLS